jgi:RNA 2',3'-cyclic 3'-phosphodiesterase
MQSTHRVFFAIDLSPQIKTQLMTYQEGLKRYFSVAVAPENFHITLSFLGKLSDRKVESIIDELRPINQADFEIELTAPIYFAKAKTIAISIKDPAQDLFKLKQKLETQVKTIQHIDLEKQRYVPHISLFKEAEPIQQQLPDISLKMSIKSIALFESVSSKKGVSYHVIEEWPMRPKMSVKQQLLGNCE